MLFRLIASLLVVLVCVGGYFAFNQTSGSAQAGSDAQQAAPAATPSSDDSQFKDLKVN